MEGYLRPGCVHVTVQAIVDSNTREASVAGGISNVMRQLIQRARLSMSISGSIRGFLTGASAACMLTTCTHDLRPVCTHRCSISAIASSTH